MKIQKITDIFVAVLFSLSLLILSIVVYVKYLWPDADFEQIMYTLCDLTPAVIKENSYFMDYILSLLLFIIVWPLGILKLKTRYQFLASILISIITLYLIGYFSYVYLSHSSSTLYEEEYVDPETITYNFPEKKRNLILIYLESFEQNFTSPKHYQTNLIPHLSAMQTADNHSLSYYGLPGTNYSVAALIAGHCGIPQRFTKNTDIWASKFFLPQAVCFPEILTKNDYQTKIIKAADITYTNVDVFAKTHGYQQALGNDELKEKYLYLKEPPYQGTFGGINDRALFDVAKKELAEFDKDKPFMLTLFSLDTHAPLYYKDTQCPQQFGDLRDSYLCTDSIVHDFVEWFKTTPYWQNTTIVITGDHVLGTRIKTKGHPKRGIFNVFLNVPNGITIDNQKEFASFDLAPTILESMGIELKPHAFGLGRSLFSKEKTLAQEQGSSLRANIMKQSAVYAHFNEPKEKRQSIYIPYTLNTELSNKDLTNYTDAYEEIFGQYYLDRLNIELSPAPSSDIEIEMTFNAIIAFGSSINFSINQKEVLNLVIDKTMRQPYKVKFNLKKEDILDNKLQLIFRNNKGLTLATEMGIAPQSFIIRNKD